MLWLSTIHPLGKLLYDRHAVGLSRLIGAWRHITFPPTPILGPRTNLATSPRGRKHVRTQKQYSMASFQIYPLSRFESGQTSIRRPRQFLQFSFDEEHKLQVFSEDSLRYYYPPFIEAPGVQIPSINLSKGFETWTKADNTVDGHLDALLETIQAHEESLLANGANPAEVRSKADLVTWRGMMTKAGLPFHLSSWSPS